jgi:hypothetical protein
VALPRAHLIRNAIALSFLRISRSLTSSYCSAAEPRAQSLLPRGRATHPLSFQCGRATRRLSSIVRPNYAPALFCSAAEPRTRSLLQCGLAMCPLSSAAQPSHAPALFCGAAEPRARSLLQRSRAMYPLSFAVRPSQLSYAVPRRGRAAYATMDSSILLEAVSIAF